MLRPLLALTLLALNAHAAGHTLAGELLDLLPDVAARRAQRLGLSRDLELPGPGAAPRGLTGRVPALADGRFVVEDTGAPASRFSFTLEGAAPVGGASLDRELTWPRAWLDVDVLAFATGQLLELSYVLHGPRAPRRFTWRQALPPGARWRTEPGGRLLLERDGAALLAIPRPRAVDASGAELAVGVELEGDALHFTLVGEPRQFPVLLDPVVEVPLWQLKEPGEPFPRWHAGAAYDAARGATVVFGGTTFSSGGYQRATDDTWTWNGTRWARQAPALSPPARRSSAMAFDVDRGEVVLFGGQDPSYGSLSDTWTWNGTTWRQAAATSPLTSPASLSWDGTRGRIVGVGRNGVVATWDGTAWTPFPPAPGPTPTAVEGFSTAVDGSGGLLLFGGSAGLGPLNETWRLDSQGWRQLTPATQPTARVNHAMAWDPVRGAIVMLGGSQGSGPFAEEWRWTGSDWARETATSPPAVQRHALVFDQARGQLLAIGGDTLSSADALWARTSSGSWDRAFALHLPLTRLGAALAFDSRRNVTVLVGGLRHGAASGDTFEWDGATWVRRLAGPARSQHALAFDPVQAVTLALGGGPAEASAWDGAAWSSRDGRSLRQLSLTWAPGIGLLLFGGIDGALNRSNDLWAALPDGGWGWLASGGPSFSGAHGAAFDKARETLVLLGNGNQSGLHVEWTANGGFVTRSSSLGPSIPSSPAVAWDADRQRTVLLANDVKATTLWEWDGTNWSAELVATAPPPDLTHLMSYDSTRHLVVLQSVGGQTWEHVVRRTQSSPCTDDWQCQTEFCVDGVCCDRPCGGGLDDCQACSPSTGTCELFPGTEVCHVASTCVLAARCTGQDPLCPAGAPDPGCDAGTGDAGTGDAGTGDAGTGDAGTGDAGTGDAGTGDAGSEPIVFRTCGCDAAGLAPALALLGLVLRRGRRRQGRAVSLASCTPPSSSRS